MLHLSHTKLEVYSLALRFTRMVYEVTAEFPRSEQFGLTTQIRRAAVSVLSNLAEGAARVSPKEKMRFFEISRSSLVEVDAQMELSRELDFCTSDQIAELTQLCNQIFAMTSGLIKKNASLD